jgi:peptidoglycan pentaglycine glycine transferase (the first glycine)
VLAVELLEPRATIANQKSSIMQVSLTAWNQFIQQQQNPHLLQTGEWGELKRAFGWDVVRLIGQETANAPAPGIQILFRPLPLGFSVAYAPKPVSEHWTDASFLAEIDAACKQKRAAFLKIEPDLWQEPASVLRPSSFVLSRHNIQPPRTITIPLTGSDDEILARMKQKCRYNVRLAEKKDVTVRTWDDLTGFHSLMTVTGGRDGFGVHSREYYQKAYELFQPRGMAEILVAEYAGKPLAALMVFALGKRAYYLYGASSDEERNRMPAYLLQWRAMQWAKERGAQEYDLWGIPDEDEVTLEANFETRHDGLWGVYRFKRGFGGEVKRAAQALDRVYIPPLYWAYNRFVARP